MNQFVEKVTEFHNVFGLTIAEKPTLEGWQLRYALMAEELQEFKEACEANDLTGALDALVDMEYINNGSVAQMGMSSIFDKAFDIVHNSNMSKTCATPAEVLQTISFYNAKGISCNVVEVTEGCNVVTNAETGKVLKNINWTEPDFSTLL